MFRATVRLRPDISFDLVPVLTVLFRDPSPEDATFNAI